MFSFQLMLLISFTLCISTVTAALTSGTYQITSVKTQTTLRSFNIGDPIVVGKGPWEVPGQFDQVSPSCGPDSMMYGTKTKTAA
jgi:hypothetical protein